MKTQNNKSDTGMKSQQQKKRKIEDISNTKPAVAKSLKIKLAQVDEKALAVSPVKTRNNRQVSSGRGTSGRDQSSSKDSTMIKSTVKKTNKSSVPNEKSKKLKVSTRDAGMEEMQDNDQSFDAQKKSEKSGKKLLNDEAQAEIEEESSQEIELTQSQVLIGNMFSLYALGDKEPTKVKAVIDQIFQHNDNTEEFVVKTMFLYFMELIGISDVTTLQYNATFIAKNDQEKKLLGLFKEGEEKFDVSFEKLIFFSSEKRQLNQKKVLKRVCKVFIADVVDLLPEKSGYLSSVVQRVCVFSKANQRLVRYCFTYIGLYLFKYLLGQQGELLKLRKNYDDKYKNEMKLKQNDEAQRTGRRIDSIASAMEIIQINLDTIQKHLILQRQSDANALVRKSVFEFLLHLDEKEMQIAFSPVTQPRLSAHQRQSKSKQSQAQKQSTCSDDLYNMVFGALKDDDSQIKKIALTMVLSIITKVQHTALQNHDDEETQDSVTLNLMKYKVDIFKLAIPTEKHQDTTIILKALQLIQKMILLIPDIYNKDHTQMLANLVHFRHQQVKEEVGEILLVLSDEFDESETLLELQKINPQKGVPEGFVLNFNENHGKSRKQLLKLIKVFEKQVQTRSQYILQKEGGVEHDQSEVNIDDSVLNVPNMDRQEVRRILSTECEERAVLLFQTFMRKTSVIYDVQSIVMLLKREDIDENTKIVLANIINIALNLTFQMKNSNTTQVNNLVYQKIWETQTAYLKLTVMNELLQTFRVQGKILEPLLRSLLTLSKTNIEKDSQAENINDQLGKDLSHLLLRMIENTEILEDEYKHPENLQIIQASILNMAQLQAYFPLMRKDIQDLGLNFCDQLQQEAISKLFNQQSNSLNQQSLSFLMKYNVLITQLSIKQISDSEHLKSLCAFAIVNFSQMILDNHHIVKQCTTNQLKCLLQLPFSFIDQLFSDVQNNREHIDFQQKIMHSLFDFYLDLHKKFKNNDQMQTVILKFIVECLILAGGENRLSGTGMNGCIVMSLNDFPRVKDLLIDTIQSVSDRLKCNESFTQTQFQILYSLFARDFQSLLSETGVEFLINFGVSKDPVVAQCIRKLYNSYKQRDRLFDNKKSIFYQFILKVIHSIYTSSDTKIYKLSSDHPSLIPGDLERERQTFGLDDLKTPVKLETYQKLAFIQQFLKNFQNSIMLLIINNAKQSDKNTSTMQAHGNGLSKQQDEMAYFKLMEGIIRLSLQDKPNNLPLLLTLRYLMHKNFLQLKQQDGTLNGLKTYINSNREAMSITHDEMEVIQTIISLVAEKIHPKKAAKQAIGDAGQKKKTGKNAISLDSSTLTNKQTGQPSADVTMNLSLTNHNITAIPSNNQDQTLIDTSTTRNKEQEEQKDETDSDNDDEEEQPSQEEIAKQKQEIEEMKGMIGQKRRRAGRGKENDEKSVDKQITKQSARNKSDAVATSNKKMKKTK
eukprot:403367644